MKRSDIETDYKVVNGRIVSLGKFQNEPVYAPHFYEAMLDGDAEEQDGDARFTLVVNDADRAEFPELADATRVELTTDDNGFVYARAWKDKRDA